MSNPKQQLHRAWLWLAFWLFAMSLAVLLSAQGCSPRRYHLNLPKHHRSS